MNLIDNTKLSWYTLPPRQHHRFFRKLPPLFIFNYQKSTKTKTTTTTKNHHDSERLTKRDPPYGFRDKGDNTHTTHQHIVQNAHCSRDIY